MNRSLATCCAVLLALCAATCVCYAEGGKPGFKRFPETISPDGAWVLAWGWHKQADLSHLKEWPKGEDNGGPAKYAGELENYLVDAVHGRVLAIIPGLTFSHTTPGLPLANYHVETHYSLYVTWSPDSTEALACYDEAWEGHEAVLIRPRTRTFIDLKSALDAAYFAHPTPSKSFHAEIPAALGRGIFAIYGWSQVGFKTDDSSYHRLRLKLTVDKDKPHIDIVSRRDISGSPDDIFTEDALNKIYKRLLESLPDVKRVALKKQQDAWLKQREALTDDDERSNLTAMRISYLQALVEE